MTPKQKDIITFIRTYRVRHGISPTLREIKAAVGCESIGNIHNILSRMQSDGLISSTRYKSRSIVVTSSNDNADPWVQIGQAALKLVNSIKAENIDDETGEGAITVDAAAFGELDAAIAEAMEVPHG